MDKANFGISQTNREIILLAIKKFLKVVRSARVDKTNKYKLKVRWVNKKHDKYMCKFPFKLLGNNI